jgi:choloylglycine hydrolase
VIVGQLPVNPPGHGSGLNGLPGNATPPARFVRTAYLKQFANQPINSSQAFNLATHILNDVDIAKGFVQDGQQEDYTQWAVVKDLAQRIFAVRTYDSMLFRALDLKQIDFANIKSHSFAITAISDITFVNVKNTVTADSV